MNPKQIIKKMIPLTLKNELKYGYQYLYRCYHHLGKINSNNTIGNITIIVVMPYLAAANNTNSMYRFPGYNHFL